MANPAVSWVDLPWDLTANILQRLRVEDFFQSAQVCTAWRRLWQDPSMWRYVDLSKPGKAWDWDKICREIVNHSEGQLISIKLGHFATDDLLFYIAHRSKQLRHLGISSNSHVCDEGFSKAVNEFSVLEELQLECCSAISKQGIEAAGQSCPFLNSFSFIKPSGFVNVPYDEEAVAIAENMHRLEHLTLVENAMTDKGMEAILDGCPRLQSVNLKNCDYVWLEGREFRKRCYQQIKDLNRIFINPLGACFPDLVLNYITDYGEIDSLDDL